MRTKTLSKSEIKAINAKLNEMYGIEPFDKKENIQLIKDKLSYIKSNNEVPFFYYEDKPVPTVKSLLEENFMKKITVDMGAVKFICSGADIMRPGIVEIDERIEKNDFVSIIDVNNKRPMAVGISLFSAGELKELDKGKAVENIHYVGDQIWDL